MLWEGNAVDQKMVWLKELEGKELRTLSKSHSKKFIVESVRTDVTQIRTGRDMRLIVEIPNRVIVESEKTLLHNKSLFIEDIHAPANPRSRSHIIALLAFKYEGLSRINYSRPLSIELDEGIESDTGSEQGYNMSSEG